MNLIPTLSGSTFGWSDILQYVKMIPTLNGSALGWSDIHYTVVPFAIFENGHYAAVLVYFDECPNVF